MRQRLGKAALEQLKTEARQLREQGLSYPAIGHLLGKDHTTILYHLDENRGAKRREQMRFYNYLQSCDGELAE